MQASLEEMPQSGQMRLNLHLYMIAIRRLMLVALCLYSLTASQPKPVPRIFIDDSIASDFRNLIQETWWQILGFFRTRMDCFGDIRITAVRDLSDRARYDPAMTMVMVRVPERGSV